MRSNRMKVAVALLATVLVAMAALAEGPGGFHRGGDFFGGPMMGMFGDALGLSDAQRTQIKEIYESAKPTIEPLWQQEKQSHKAMMQLITSGNFDEAKAQAIIAQSSQAREQLEMQHAILGAKAYQVLTADQKAKFNDMLAQHEQRMQERMQRHQGTSAEQSPDQ